MVSSTRALEHSIVSSHPDAQLLFDDILDRHTFTDHEITFATYEATASNNLYALSRLFSLLPREHFCMAVEYMPLGHDGNYYFTAMPAALEVAATSGLPETMRLLCRLMKERQRDRASDTALIKSRIIREHLLKPCADVHKRAETERRIDMIQVGVAPGAKPNPRRILGTSLMDKFIHDVVVVH